tara:strand:- start:10747 stop:11436 length:690 start_codon:yes stop_codon:yes gene_type:complete
MAKHFAIDGIDSSGKGVATNAAKTFFEEQGKKVFDLREYWKDHDDYPDISEYDVIIGTEPTFSALGKKIRFEMIKNKTQHTHEEITEAYANDRKEQLEKAILPALKQNKIVIQERCVISAMVYQTCIGLTHEFIKNLEGNQVAFKNPPEVLIITTVNPENAIKRLDTRDKKDDAIFEKLDFLKKAEDKFESDFVETHLPKTKVIRFNTNPPKTPEDTKQEVYKILKENS